MKHTKIQQKKGLTQVGMQKGGPARTAYRQGGFVMLFSIVISAIILLMSATVFKIASQQLILSGTNRESMRAFYAADSGIECALGNSLHTLVTLPSTVICGGPVQHPLVNEAFSVSFSDNTCALVTVIETIDVVTGQASREIVSRGFNTGCPNGQPDFAYKSIVERSLHIRFAAPQTSANPTAGVGGGLQLPTTNPGGVFGGGTASGNAGAGGTQLPTNNPGGTFNGGTASGTAGVGGLLDAKQGL